MKYKNNSNQCYYTSIYFKMLCLINSEKNEPNKINKSIEFENLINYEFTLVIIMSNDL